MSLTVLHHTSLYVTRVGICSHTPGYRMCVSQHTHAQFIRTLHTVLAFSDQSDICYFSQISI